MSMTEESLTLNGRTIVQADPLRSVDDVVAAYDLAEDTTVSSADGTDAWYLRDILDDAWYHALWQASRMTTAQLARWLTADSADRADIWRDLLAHGQRHAVVRDGG